jgi:hypothetical protein
MTHTYTNSEIAQASTVFANFSFQATRMASWLSVLFHVSKKQKSSRRSGLFCFPLFVGYPLGIDRLAALCFGGLDLWAF